MSSLLSSTWTNPAHASVKHPAEGLPSTLYPSAQNHRIITENERQIRPELCPSHSETVAQWQKNGQLGASLVSWRLWVRVQRYTSFFLTLPFAPTQKVPRWIRTCSLEAATTGDPRPVLLPLRHRGSVVRTQLRAYSSFIFHDHVTSSRDRWAG